MRIVQVGLGRAGAGWARLVQETAGVELTGVVDADPETLARARDELGLPDAACVPSLAEALERCDAEAVLVVTPPASHAAVAIEALQAGKHVLIEKPLATELSEAAAMLRAARAVGRTLMVSQNYRFQAPVRAIRAVVADGTLGGLLAVRIEFRRDTRGLFPPGDFRYGMRHPLLLDMAIHHFDLLRATTGQDVATAFARTWPAPDSPYLHHPSVAASLGLTGGAVATYDGDWAARADETSWDANWELIGTEGRLVWRGDPAGASHGELSVQRWGRDPEPVGLPMLAATDRAGVLAAFRDAVTAGKRPETDGTDNVRSLAVVLAAVRSADTGEVVDVTALLDAALG